MARGTYTLATAATVTASGVVGTASPDLEPEEPLLAELNIAGPVTGTTPTLTVTIQGSIDGGSTWFNVQSFPQQTAALAAPITLSLAAGTFGHRVRASAAVGGTTPSFGGVTVEVG